ncbi:hypothetical protein EXS73_02275 [Candidatus Pacearchaeota archaeon]|nr:hypothetical protein [Candidatus Pacearchaeota archaeon]
MKKWVRNLSFTLLLVALVCLVLFVFPTPAPSSPIVESSSVSLPLGSVPAFSSFERITSFVKGFFSEIPVPVSEVVTISSPMDEPLFSPSVLTPANQNVLCVYNRNSALSTQVCAYYLQKRPGARSLGVSIPDDAFAEYWRASKELLHVDTFYNLVINPVLAYTADKPEITHLAVAKDVPFLVWDPATGHGRDSAAGYLMMPYGSNQTPVAFYPGGLLSQPYTSLWVNPYANAGIHFNRELYRNSSGGYTLRFVASWLQGYTLEDIQHTIDKAVAPAQNRSEVTWLLDKDTDNFSVYEQDLAELTRDLLYRSVSSSRISVQSDNLVPLTSPTPVLGYYGPGYYHAGYPHTWVTESSLFSPTLAVANRSIYGTIESYAAFSAFGNASHFNMTDPAGIQSKIVDSFSSRAFGGTAYSNSFAGALGAVEEPGQNGITQSLRALFRNYAQGLTFAESAAGIVIMHGPIIPFGDPLMRISDDPLKQPFGARCSAGAECMSGLCEPDINSTLRCVSREIIPGGSCLLPRAYDLTHYINATSYCQTSISTFTCLNGQTSTTTCPESTLCKQFTSALTQARCLLRDGERSLSPSLCYSNETGFDLFGNSRCVSASGRCSYGVSDIELNNATTMCLGRAHRFSCLNGNWSVPVVDCTCASSVAECVEQQRPPFLLSPSNYTFGDVQAVSFFVLANATHPLKSFFNVTRYSLTHTLFSINATSGQVTNSSSLSPGMYLLPIVLSDFFLNRNTTSVTVQISLPLDVMPPVIISPTPLSLIYGQSVGVTFSAQDNILVDTFSVNDSRFTISRNGLLTNKTALGAGIYTLNVSVNDSRNNINSTLYRVTINPLSSSVSLTLNGVAGNLSIVSGEGALISASRIKGESTMSLRVDGLEVNNSASLILNRINITVLGNHSVNVSHASTQNYSANSTVVYIEVRGALDSTPPQVILVSPASGTLTRAARVWFAANFSDGIALTNATLRIWNSTNSLINITSRTITGTSNFTNISVTLPAQGNYSWNYLALDSNNNLAFNHSNFSIQYSFDCVPGATLACPVLVDARLVNGVNNACDAQGRWTNVSTCQYMRQGVVFLSNLTHTYAGTSHRALVSTEPVGLQANVTYNGRSALPVAGGNYTVVATILNESYEGNVTGRLEIRPALQSLQVPDLLNDGIRIVFLERVLSGSASSGLPITFEVVSGGETFEVVTAGDSLLIGNVIGALEARSGLLLRVWNWLKGQVTSAEQEITSVGLSPSTLANGTRIRFIQPGNLVLRAVQAGNENYSAALPIERIIPVIPSNAELLRYINSYSSTYRHYTANYTGLPQSFVFEYAPTKINISIYYNGSLSEPTNPGYYPMVIISNDRRYLTNNLTGHLFIDKLYPAVTFTPVGILAIGQTITLQATSNAPDLPIFFEVSGPATLSGNNLTVTGPGIIEIEASTGENQFYYVGTKVHYINGNCLENQVPDQGTCKEVCTSFTYSGFGVCSEQGQQTQTVLSAVPTGCVQGNPTLTQPCTRQCTPDTRFGVCPEVVNGTSTGTSQQCNALGTAYFANSTCSLTCAIGYVKVQDTLNPGRELCVQTICTPDATTACTSMEHASVTGYANKCTAFGTGFITNNGTVENTCVYRCDPRYHSNGTACVQGNSVFTLRDVRLFREPEGLFVFPNETNTSYIVFGSTFEETRLGNLSVTIEQEDEREAFVIVRNVSLRGDEVKTIILKTKRTRSNAVCIADRSDIVNHSDIERRCFVLACPGVNGSYTCEKLDDRFLISGLRHSGVIETRIVQVTNDTFVALPPSSPSPLFSSNRTSWATTPNFNASGVAPYTPSIISADSNSSYTPPRAPQQSAIERLADTIAGGNQTLLFIEIGSFVFIVLLLIIVLVAWQHFARQQSGS